MTTIERIYIYMQEKNISAYAFEKKVGLSNGYLHNRKGGSRGLGSEILERIYRSFPDLNLIWLVTGEGKMEVSPHESNLKMQAQSASPIASPIENKHDTPLDDYSDFKQQEIIELLKQQIITLKEGNADKDKIIALLETQLNKHKSTRK